jgi:hypothetical protein
MKIRPWTWFFDNYRTARTWLKAKISAIGYFSGGLTRAGLHPEKA